MVGLWRFRLGLVVEKFLQFPLMLEEEQKARHSLLALVELEGRRERHFQSELVEEGSRKR